MDTQSGFPICKLADLSMFGETVYKEASYDICILVQSSLEQDGFGSETCKNCWRHTTRKCMTHINNCIWAFNLIFEDHINLVIDVYGQT